jgi:hypothetical protein
MNLVAEIRGNEEQLCKSRDIGQMTTQKPSPDVLLGFTPFMTFS